MKLDLVVFFKEILSLKLGTDCMNAIQEQIKMISYANFLWLPLNYFLYIQSTFEFIRLHNYLHFTYLFFISNPHGKFSLIRTFFKKRMTNRLKIMTNDQPGFSLSSSHDRQNLGTFLSRVYLLSFLLSWFQQ